MPSTPVTLAFHVTLVMRPLHRTVHLALLVRQILSLTVSVALGVLLALLANTPAKVLSTALSNQHAQKIHITTVIASASLMSPLGSLAAAITPVGFNLTSAPQMYSLSPRLWSALLVSLACIAWQMELLVLSVQKEPSLKVMMFLANLVQLERRLSRL